MSKSIKLAVTIWILSIVAFAGYSLKPSESIQTCPAHSQCNDDMPVVKIPLPTIHKTSLPNAKTNERYSYYLQCSVRIQYVTGDVTNVGSGTICYYDYETKETYIISCGHIFEKYTSIEKSPIYVTIFYKNQETLSSPENIKAELICYDMNEDISFLKFKSDWIPQHWFPIAPEDHILNQGDLLESTGCDSGGNPASYTVEVITNTVTGNNTVTRNNSPRPGRSGGGLFSDQGYLVGIVWGTTIEDGSGYGFYVPINRIHAYMKNEPKIAWLLKASYQWNFIYKIPLIMPNGEIRQMPDGYIPNI